MRPLHKGLAKICIVSPIPAYIFPFGIPWIMAGTVKHITDTHTSRKKEKKHYTRKKNTQETVGGHHFHAPAQREQEASLRSIIGRVIEGEKEREINSTKVKTKRKSACECVCVYEFFFSLPAARKCRAEREGGRSKKETTEGRRSTTFSLGHLLQGGCSFSKKREKFNEHKKRDGEDAK